LNTHQLNSLWLVVYSSENSNKLMVYGDENSNK